MQYLQTANVHWCTSLRLRISIIPLTPARLRVIRVKLFPHPGPNATD